MYASMRKGSKEGARVGFSSEIGPQHMQEIACNNGKREKNCFKVCNNCLHTCNGLHNDHFLEYNI